MRRILVHACCGPCLIYPHGVLGKESELEVFFFNPNIHPSMEYARRLEALSRYCEMTGLPLEVGEYEIGDYFRSIENREGKRCRGCYELRLKKTAFRASAMGFDAFTTTLSVSPYQDHDLIAEVGNDAGREAGVRFLYIDFRSGYREGRRTAADLGMYRQAYCGCVYSEAERYEKKLKRAVENVAAKGRGRWD